MAPSMPVRLVDKDGNLVTADNPLPTSATLDIEGGIEIEFPPGLATEAAQDEQTAELTSIKTAVETLSSAVDTDEDVVNINIAGGILPDTESGDLSTIADAIEGVLDVDINSALPAGDNVIGRIGTPDIVVPVTPALDTNAYADGDLLFNSTEITGGVRVNGHTAIIQTITVIDKDDRKTPMTLLFADANTNFGTVNQPPNPSDAAAETVVGHMEITAEDYVDLGGASVACVKAIGMLVKAGAATTSLWIAAISRGTPTHTASGLVIKVGLLRS